VAVFDGENLISANRGRCHGRPVAATKIYNSRMRKILKLFSTESAGTWSDNQFKTCVSAYVRHVIDVPQFGKSENGRWLSSSKIPFQTIGLPTGWKWYICTMSLKATFQTQVWESRPLPCLLDDVRYLWRRSQLVRKSYTQSYKDSRQNRPKGKCIGCQLAWVVIVNVLSPLRSCSRLSDLSSMYIW